MNRTLPRWIWLLLLVPALAGGWRLRLDVEVLHLLPSDLPVVRGLKLFQRHFASDHELILTVQAPTADAAEAAAKALVASLRARTDLVSVVVWQPPWLEHPELSAEFLAYLWLNQPPAEVAALLDRLDRTRLKAALGDTVERLTTSLSPAELGLLGNDPFGLTRLPMATQPGGSFLDPAQGGFASADGTFRALFLKPGVAPKNYRACADWLAQIQAVVAMSRRSADWPAEVSLGYTGSPAFVAEAATGMERDLQQSAWGTLLVIAGLFAWAHRRWWPLVWLTILLVLVVAGTLALGGLIFGTLNVVSLGFAAILLGLAVDYALVLYQEAMAAPERSVLELRRSLAPAILASAITTAGAFLVLNFGGLPGMSQLGTLVALGVLLAAGVMLRFFLPVALRGHRRPHSAAARETAPPTGSMTPTRGRADLPRSAGNATRTGFLSGTLAVWAVTGGLVLATGLVLWQKPPAIDYSTAALQPAGSAAQQALTAMNLALGQTAEPLLLVIPARNEAELGGRLDALSHRLAQAVARGAIRNFTLPTPIWPRSEWQSTNRVRLGGLAARETELRGAATTAGFTPDAFALTQALMAEWRRAAGGPLPFWPTNAFSQWVLGKAVARNAEGWVVLGGAQAGTNAVAQTVALGTELADQGVLLAGWPMLGEVLLRRVERRVVWLVAAMVLMLLGSLILTFRRPQEVLLSLLTLAISIAVLLTVMALAGWSWNLLNLMALPLLLGAGVDYAIHIQLALRRHGGRVREVRQVTGRALFLCAATTVAGFGSLAWSGNLGLASLGLICATGVACVYGVALGLLPGWWLAFQPVGQASPDAGVGSDAPSRPPAFYRAELWRLGLWTVRWVPGALSTALGAVLARAYGRLHPRRREVVVQNLLPVLEGDRAAATAAAGRLFGQFGRKVVDLWRYEAGAPVDTWFNEWSNPQVLQSLQASGRGILLVTVHLGNWEFGAPFLARHGSQLLVLTQPEPGNGLTEIRRASRARWHVETLVIGDGAFAFVEVIQRLQAGATVALLLDRPPEQNAVTIELFGRPFRASAAAAELARASGCAVVPVQILRKPDGYAAHVSPEMTYDRAALGDREARRLLTQQILRAFEPAIRQHPDQWFHFVPVW